MKILIFCMSLLSCVANASLMSRAVSAPAVSLPLLSNETTEGLFAVYTTQAALYKYTSDFRCSDTHKIEAKKMAEDGALQQCYKAGHETCIVKISSIIADGYLGYREVFNENLGWGCIAEATTHGK